jgi:hypothetical protein
MQKTILLLVAAVGGGLMLPTPVEAAKAEKREGRMAARMLGRFDANKDGSLDATESERVRKAFAALKGLDTDKNGELSDSEIGAAKVVTRKGKGKGKKTQ